MTTSATDLSIAVPTTWRRRSDPARGVLVAARSASLPLSGVRPDLTLRSVPVAEVEPTVWRDTALAELAVVLVDFDLEDDDAYDLDGREVLYHRFAHRIGTADVLCDQWSWLVDGTGVTLTCSAAREDYPAYCDLFEAIAATIDLDRQAA